MDAATTLTLEDDRSQDGVALALEMLAAGKTTALEALWDLCAADLLGLALWRSGDRNDAEDAVQEVFVKLAKSPSAASQAALARNPRAYLLGMVRRAAIDQSRKRRGEPLSAVAFLEAPGPDPACQADASRASALVARLPEKLREVVFLRHFSGLTFREIARVVAVPQFTAASRYRLAIRRLRQWMEVR